MSAIVPEGSCLTWVHERVFAAGGEQIPQTWDDFAEQTGVTAVLHLRPSRPTRFERRPPLSFLWLDLAEEAQAGMAERRLASRFIEDCLARGQSVLLHSSLGRHRTRWAYVAYAIRAGRAVRTALRQAAEAPWLAPYRTDEDAWERFAQIIRAGRSQAT